MRIAVVVTALVVGIAACSDGGGGDDQRPLRFDGPAEVDPDFRQDPGSDSRTDGGG